MGLRDDPPPRPYAPDPRRKSDRLGQHRLADLGGRNVTHPTPIAVHRDGLVLFDDDSLGAVLVWFDSSGQPCNVADAVGCVAHGPTGWWALDLRAFEEITAH